MNLYKLLFTTELATTIRIDGYVYCGLPQGIFKISKNASGWFSNPAPNFHIYLLSVGKELARLSHLTLLGISTALPTYSFSYIDGLLGGGGDGLTNRAYPCSSIASVRVRKFGTQYLKELGHLTLTCGVKGNGLYAHILIKVSLIFKNNLGWVLIKYVSRCKSTTYMG